MNPLPDPRSPLQMNSNGLRNSHPLSTRQRLSSDDRRPFPQMKSPRNSAGGTPSHLTGTYANNRERNPYNPISFNDPNEPGSSNNREKEKKLQEDDSFNQYVNNLSGQTQQLMQLHQVRVTCIYWLESLENERGNDVRTPVSFKILACGRCFT